MRIIVSNLYSKHSLQIRYFFMGGINTVVGIVCFPVLYFLLPEMRSHYLALMIISQVFCISSSYVINKYFVFRSKEKSFLEYLRFISFYNVVFVANLIVLPHLVTEFHFNPAKIQFVINIAIAISGYFWHRYITFKRVVQW